MVGLEDKADFFIPDGGQFLLWEVGQFLTVEPDAAAGRGVERAEDVEQGAFAGAGRTDDRDGLAPPDG